MLEIVVAIMIIVAMTVMLSNAFAPWMHFEKRMSTEDRLNSLMKATEAMYRGRGRKPSPDDAPGMNNFGGGMKCFFPLSASAFSK